MKLKSSQAKENNEVELVVEVEPQEFEPAMNKAYTKNRNNISVPGFRKGKAPRKIIEKMYGAEIFLAEALDVILPDALEYAMKETEYDVVGFPKVSDVDVKDNNTRVEITLLAALRPEVTLGEYKGLAAPKPTVEVLDSEIESEIESIRERNARIEKADRPAQNGDIAVIDFEGFVDNVAFEGGKGENYELTLGSGQFIPGFEEKVEGMEAGEERDIDLVFPEQYKEDLAGKPVVFKVKLNEVKEKILPELDDEFAKDVSEFDTFDEYKADLIDKRRKLKQEDVDEAFTNALMDQIIETMEAEIPEAMIDEQVETQKNNLARQMSAFGMQPDQYMRMMGLTQEQFKQRIRESSEQQVKISLALEKIAELEGLEVSDAEVEDEFIEAARRYNMEAEEVKEKVEREGIVRDLKLRKAAKFVADNAIAEEFSGEEEKEEEEEK